MTWIILYIVGVATVGTHTKSFASLLGHPRENPREAQPREAGPPVFGEFKVWRAWQAYVTKIMKEPYFVEPNPLTLFHFFVGVGLCSVWLLVGR